MRPTDSHVSNGARLPNIERGSRLLHLVDKLLGIPLVLLLGTFRRRRTFPSAFSPRRVGLLQLAAIGDTVLLSGATRDIRTAWPTADVTLFVSSTNREVAHLLQGIDRVVTLPVRYPLAAAKEIRGCGEFDVWLDFGAWPRLNALYTLTARASYTFGFSSRRQFRHYGYDVVVAHQDTVHELENYRNLLSSVGLASTSNPSLTVHCLESAPLLAELGRPFAVIHMFPGGVRAYMKEWVEKRWVEVCEFLLSKGIGILFTGSPNDYARANEIMGALASQGRVVNGAGKMSLEEVATALGHATIVISVNTGIMHMAAAVNAPLLAIHGPTSSQRWGPVSSTAVVITPKDTPCSPCLHLGFDYGCHVPNCMRSISTQEVLEAIKQILGSADRFVTY